MELRLKQKHPLAIRWFHWIHFPLLTLMTGSGLLIYWANDIYSIRVGSATVFHFFPEWFYQRFGIAHRLAEGMAWHFFIMWLFAGNGLLYVLYTAVSGEWRFLVPNRHSLSEAFQVVLYDLGVRKRPLPDRKFNGAQQIAYTSVVLMGLASLATGMAIYRPIQFGWLTQALGGYQWARFEHFWLTVGYVLFFVIHIAQVTRAGWNNLRAMIVGYEIEGVPQ